MTPFAQVFDRGARKKKKPSRKGGFCVYIRFFETHIASTLGELARRSRDGGVKPPSVPCSKPNFRYKAFAPGGEGGAMRRMRAVLTAGTHQICRFHLVGRCAHTPPSKTCAKPNQRRHEGMPPYSLSNLCSTVHIFADLPLYNYQYPYNLFHL